MAEERSIQKIIKRDGTTAKYNRDRIANAIFKATGSTGNPDKKLADTMAEKVEGVLLSTYKSDTMPTVEDIQDVVESVLMEDRHAEIARNYIIYRHQRAMARASKAYAFEVTDYVPYRKIYEVLRWNMEHECDSVQGLNKIIAHGSFPDLVRAADLRYTEEVNAVASEIVANLSNVRIVIVAGPSSSGKTTTTIKISEKLAAEGIGFKAINIDNYFWDLDRHPKDEFGDYDYETPAALDLDLINEHLQQLLDGKGIKTPHYNFKTGIRTLNVHELSLGRNEILLIDSLHGLYEPMTHSVPPKNKFKVYIETLGQFRTKDGSFMRWSDNRLLRRMKRDKDHRNLQPTETLTHWHYVRRSELKNIIPFIKQANCIINSALPYELPIFKHYLLRYISKSTRAYRDDPRRRDAHIRANRVYELLAPLKSVADHSCVPEDSLLREFIGGSKYKY